MPVIKANRVKLATDFRITHYSSNQSGSCIVGSLNGYTLGEMGSIWGNDSFGLRPYLYGMKRNTTEGSPTSPCVQLDYPNTFFRFRWVVKPGQRRIAVRVKQQIHNYSSQLPTMVIKANANVGISSDIITTAPSSNEWTLIGPTVLTITGTDVVFVEIWNNLLLSNCPLFIDRIVVT